MRRKDDTLRGTLLDHARNLADTEGLDAVNIRSIARLAGVAAGTVYNYFSNKEEILLALTEEYWNKTLAEMSSNVTAESFCGQLEEIFSFLKERIDSSAGMLMHSLGNLEAAGQERMLSMQLALEASMIQGMDRDPKVRKDVWDDTFTKEQYVRFLVRNLTMLLGTRAPDLSFLITLVKRTIY